MKYAGIILREALGTPPGLPMRLRGDFSADNITILV
jgi:hypothetical protein